MPFQIGNKLATGGRREGSGAPTNWLKEKCRKIISDKKLLEFLGDVASGEPFVGADVKDRLRAVEMLLDRGFGRPPQMLVDSEGNAFPFVVIRPDEQVKKAA